MTKADFYNHIPINFSRQQREAIETVDGPVLLLAVPGSGKTTVLVARLGYMILCRNISPSDILVLTYTVSAAGDMKRRFESLFGSELAEKIEFRTINGICAKVILRYGFMIGREPFELIADEKITAAILSKIYREVCSEFPTEGDIKGVKAAITFAKNRMLSPESIKELDKEIKIPFSKIFKIYNQELKSKRKMDYDDQLVYAYKLLISDAQLLSEFQSKYKYICVDEAQDTSKIQHEIIALLSNPQDNLFMVGDEDQSIYGFRAAYPDALISFENDHKNAKVLLMETNYRSSGEIVSAADSFIQKNTLRHQKSMKASRPKGKEIRIIDVNNLNGQYSYILKASENSDGSAAVLYRDNESAVPLADALERANIPFTIRTADYTFFTNRSVSDVKNILNFAYNQYDGELFLQIYYKIDLFVNKQAAEKAAELSMQKDITILNALLLDNSIKPFTKTSIEKIQTQFYSLKNESAAKALFRIFECCGYKNYLERAHMSPRKLSPKQEIGR